MPLPIFTLYTYCISFYYFVFFFVRLCGCYEALSGGLASEAMTDFTGGVAERFNFREEVPENMFRILTKAKHRHSLMGCSIDVSY